MWYEKVNNLTTKEQNYRLNIPVNINKVWKQILEGGVENWEKKNLTVEEKSFWRLSYSLNVRIFKIQIKLCLFTPNHYKV